jgi:hypothetical protein
MLINRERQSYIKFHEKLKKIATKKCSFKERGRKMTNQRTNVQQYSNWNNRIAQRHKVKSVMAESHN